MEVPGRPLCKFGAKCYRTNPKHLQTYYHPCQASVEGSDLTLSAGKLSQEAHHKNRGSGFDSRSEKHKTAKLSGKYDVSTAPKPQTGASARKNILILQSVKEEESHFSEPKKKKLFNRKKPSKIMPLKRRRNEVVPEERNTFGIPKKYAKTSSCFSLKGNDSSGEDNKGSSNCESVCSMSWIFTKNNETEAEGFLGVTQLKNKTPEEIIKTLFLVDMPPDFYSFYEFCKFIEKSLHLKASQFGELKLVGPFDILSGNINYSFDPDFYLCYWRFHYDPPEFQTVLASELGYHIGYWRDDPKENPVFLASNDPNKDCTFKIEAENLFGAIFHYLNEYSKTSDPFKKAENTKLQLALKNWAQKNKFSLATITDRISERQKKIVSKTFHGAGIVVPVEVKTKLGYRPLIVTDATLKNICNLIMKVNDESEVESLWENLQPLITAANVANDECDFGNSLELGIDLFCMGSPIFHETIEHLLSTAYSLLDRIEFEKIIRAHLKFRQKGDNLSLCC